jgi:hypothetical protein
MINNKDNKSLGFGAWLSIVGLDRRIVQLEPEESFFSQGDSADCVYCLQAGRAKIGVVSEKGKQATVTILSPGDFFGEWPEGGNSYGAECLHGIQDQAGRDGSRDASET